MPGFPQKQMVREIRNIEMSIAIKNAKHKTKWNMFNSV